YENSKLESKGFMPSTEISDFPIRGQKVTLHIRRRRWTVLDTGEIITRDWNLVR
ncbi:ISAon1 family transposase N-terminal region protein, partial [Sphingobacterium sp. UBA6645]